MHDIQRDIRIILQNQHASGAYVASPAFSQYPYCWLRDGSFIAHAMDRAGEYDSARAFHAWVAGVITRFEPHIRDLIAAKERGTVPDHSRMPPARFTLGGDWEEDDWPSFQLDGYGQWLWSLACHQRQAGSLPDDILFAAEVVAEYLAAYWNEPCFDAWEEGRTQQHTSTLASACAGLRAAAELVSPSYTTPAEAALVFIRERCIMDGHFTKSVRNRAVDASLLWLATPFELVSDGDAIFARTLECIERDLLADGGLMRYEADTFYGGGAWILLTAWLGWHHARNGRMAKAQTFLDWVESQRGEGGSLPEQVQTSRTDTWFLYYWTERWGTPAHPLLWSHAMVILTALAIAGKETGMSVA